MVGRNHPLTRALDARRVLDTCVPFTAPRAQTGGPVQPAPSLARDSALPAPVVKAAPADAIERIRPGGFGVTIGNKAPVKKKRATIARRSVIEAEETDGTSTPLWLAEKLGCFDFDPCSNARSHITATRRYAQDGSHTHGTDGLAPTADWSGRGFLNNPWSKPIAWMLRAQRALTIGGCVDLVVLCKCDPGTEWFHAINAAPADPSIQGPPELWHFHKRVQFEEHPNVIERRRCERLADAIAAGEADPVKLGKITGKSTANFNSMIIHHRGPGRAVLDLYDVATRYVRAFA